MVDITNKTNIIFTSTTLRQIGDALYHEQVEEMYEYNQEIAEAIRNIQNLILAFSYLLGAVSLM